MRLSKGCVLLLSSFAWALSCGGAQRPAAPAPEAEPFRPEVFLLDYGNARLEQLQPPEGTAEELEAAVAAAEGEAAARARLDAAVAHLFEAQDSEDEAATRRHFRAAARLAARAGRGCDDPAVAATAAFVEIWCAWRQDQRAARTLLGRLFRAHGGAPADLLRLAHAIEGEMALAAEQYDEATAAFRELVGAADDALYVYSCYRLARCLEATGQDRLSRQALREVRDLGCDGSAAESIRHLAELAAVDLGTGLARTEEGRVLPASCLPEAGD